jgi:hypothetical protein
LSRRDATEEGPPGATPVPTGKDRRRLGISSPVEKGETMELKILPWHFEGETLYHVIKADAPQGAAPPVVFTGTSWIEAEQYIADLGGG